MVNSLWKTAALKVIYARGREPSLNLRPSVILLEVIQLLHSQRRGEQEWGSCQWKPSDIDYFD